jgi:hypothetical protein
VIRHNRAVWLVLATGTVLGLGVFLYHLVARPATVGLDYRVFHAASEAALAGRDFYAVSPADSSFQYLYPPVTVLSFVPLAALDGWVPGYLALTALSLVASALAARVLCRHVASLGHTVPPAERVLVGAWLTVSTPAALSLVYGQTNHLAVAGLVVGLAGLLGGRDRLAGVVLALPAYLKVLPGVVGLYLLRRRAPRAIGAGLGTALALTAVGVAVFGPDLHLTYLTEVLVARRDTAAFVGGLDPAAEYVTLRRPLSVVFPAADPALYAVGAAALLFPVLAALYWRVETHTDRVVALHGTLVVGLLVVPSLLLYAAFLAFPLVVLLYELPAGRARRLFVAGGLLTNLSVSFDGIRQLFGAVPLGAAGREWLLSLFRPVFTVGTPVLYGCLLSLAGCLVYRWTRRRATRPESTPR